MGEPMRDIADQLERLAREIRAAADATPTAGEATGTPLEREVEDALAEARRRLEAEADRVVAAAVRVLESAPSSSIAQAEREARERILAATESACERIEAVDHAQERVASALSRLSPPPGADARRG
ncbi:MAG: hypothetical protein ACRDL3_06285 [Solirubrobacterales bacterium]